MRNGSFGRRAFLGQAGACVGLLSLGAVVPAALARTADAGGHSKTDAARVRKVLDGMEPKIGRYWSTPRKDAELLHFMMKAARAARILEVGTSQGYSAIAVHNAISEAGGMKNYTDMIRRHPEFDTVIVSTTMDDGICMSCRHRRS